MPRPCSLPLLGTLLGTLLAPLARAQAPPPPPLLIMSAPGPQERVLVVAPHPDDESLCCAGLLQRARANGAAIAVVWITAGDGFELDAMLAEHTLWPKVGNLERLGARRLMEARAAADQLGVPRSQQYVLGYPDHGVVPLLGGFYSRTYHSRYTGLSTVSYPQALSPYAIYTGANLERDLERVMEEYRPTLVLAAAPQDLHPDHYGSGELARRLLERRGELPRLRYWIVHARRWPRPRGYHPGIPLLPPASAAALQWRLFPLDGAERARKLAALREHGSQMRLTAPFMYSFVRANEIFAAPGDWPGD